MSEIWIVLKHTSMVTLFVFAMMTVVDYFNVLTNGRMSAAMKGGPWRQYTVASFLGATPGCLGAYLNVSFYIHGLLTFGAIVGGMMATSGDEAFVMLALFPGQALLLFVLLFVLGVLFARFTDGIASRLHIVPCQGCTLQRIHTIETCQCFDKAHLAQNFLHISLPRAVLLLGALVCLIAIATGIVGPEVWGWKRVTLTILITILIAILGSVPGHYLREHIWDHIVRRHLGRVFLWSFVAILIVEMGLTYWDFESFVKTHMVWILLISGLAGVVPESGPHMIFVMMFAQGLIPFSVLLTSSIVQDGHGMLPLLSYTVKDSALIKVFNLVFGMSVGSVCYILGL
jgi:hypothetical protein